MKLRFNELDFTVFRNATELYDSIFANINNCLFALSAMRDDLFAYAQDQLGARGRWSFKTSGNYNSAAPAKRAGTYGLQGMYFSQEIEINREKPHRQFFINVEYTYDEDVFDTFVFWWQIGQTKKQVDLGLLFDESLLGRLKVAATKAGAKCYLAWEDVEADLPDWRTIYTGIPVNLVTSAESVSDQHRLFKNTIVKPMLRQL